MVEDMMNERKRAMSVMTEHHHEIEHPNADRQGNANLFASIRGEDEPFSWPKSSFVNWFMKFDEEKMKPFFIRKYSRVK